MAFNFNKYKSNNPLLQELENIDQYAEDGEFMAEDKYPRVEFEDAVRKALQAGIDKNTLHKIIDWN